MFGGVDLTPVNLHLLGVLFVVLVIARIATVRFRAASRGRIDEPISASVALLQLSRDGGVKANAAALRMFGLSQDAGPKAEDFARLMEGEDGGFSAWVENLSSSGKEFRQLATTKDDRIIEVVGDTNAGDAVVSFFERTDEINRLRAVEAERDNAAEKLRLIEPAMRKAGIHLICSGDDASGAGAPGCGDSENYDVRIANAARSIPDDRFEGARVELAGENGDDASRFFEFTELPGDEHEPPARFAREVTEVVAAEQAMNQLVFTMSETFAHLKVGLLIFDAELRLTLFNLAIVELFSEDAAWLATRPHFRVLLDRMRTARNLPEQRDFPTWRKELFERLEAEEMQPFEESWQLPDGRTIKALFRPHPSGGMALVLEDVTESLVIKRNSASVRAVADATTELLEEGIAVFGPDGMLRMSNPSFRSIWGLTAEFCHTSRHVGDIVAACVPATTGDATFWDRLRAASTSGVRAAALREKIANAENRVYIAKTSYAPDGSMLVVFNEISAEERMAAALRERNDVLEQADEMRGALVDQISHQIRTPLNSVLGFAQLLAESNIGPLTRVQHEYVEGIIDSARDIVEAIDGMSELISLDVEDVDDGAEPTSFVQTVEDVMTMVRRRLGDASPTVELRLDDDVAGLVTNGRAGRVRQILFNLLLDASSKTLSKRKIVFSAQTVDENLNMECAYETRRGAQSGGLALSLVRRFARLSGGDATRRIEDDWSKTCCVIPLKALAAQAAQQAAKTKILKAATH